jgi:transposase
MGRHRTSEEKRELGERARALRAAGRSRREIQAELGIGDDLACQLLTGTEVPDSLRRPRAKDDLREVARQLREAGGSYNAITAELGVSKSTLSHWLRDLPPSAGPPAAVPSSTPLSDVDSRRQAARELRKSGLLLREIAEQLGLSIKTVSVHVRGLPWAPRSRHGGGPEHVREMAEARWADHRRRRDADAQQRKLNAALAVGDLDDRTLLLLGAVAYWCEGSKSKPWRPQGKWVFINSDPVLVRLMVRWLRLLEIPPERWVVRIQIHETADLAGAEAHWRHVLGVPELEFGKALIKRHKPLTNRRNVGETYHGCASIYVRNGAQLLQQVEGWVVGALLGAGGVLPHRAMPWAEGWEDEASRLPS